METSTHDKQAIRKLLTILDFHTPAESACGRYSQCQKKLAACSSSESWLNEILRSDDPAGHYKQWQAIVDSAGLDPQIAIAQLFAGQLHLIHDTETNCNLRLSLFADEGVISRLCHDCYKVQILPLNLTTFVRLYFVLRSMNLARDNCRKCMVEMRNGIQFPYKGYIYCESEVEAHRTLVDLRKILDSLGITDVYCAISHGCSEYGLKYPDFKYSADGSHRTFERPASWDRSETEYFSRRRLPDRFRKNYKHGGVTLSDVIGIKTWIDYAEIIGDESFRRFRSGATAVKPEPFTTIVANQSRARKDELKELSSRIGCGA